MPYKNPDDQREYQRLWRARRRSDWLSENGPCVRCGSWEDLEVDHTDRTKKVAHNVWSWSPARREAELAKCQILCHPCHVEKTWKEDFLPRQHGTDAMYGKGKCRCLPCREARSIAKKANRQRRKALGLPHQ